MDNNIEQAALSSTENIKQSLDSSVQESKNLKKKFDDDLKTLGEYVKEVSKELPRETFKAEPTRLKYLLLFVGGGALVVWAVMTIEMPWFAKLPLSLLLGMFLGGNTFLGHEILHGSIVKNKTLQNILGVFTFSNFLIGPTYWKFWHNKLHHGNTQLLYKDPDAFPTKMIWKNSKFMQFVFPLSPGSGTIRSYFYFFYWFSFQAFLNQIYMRFGNKMWANMDHTRVSLEFALSILISGTYVWFVGVENFLWLVAIPFFVMNYTVMSYISTNHNISPYTKKNDPLVNSLTVTNHPILEFLNLNFGYHTEHHLFPNMPASKGKILSKKLKEMYPDRYKTMPKSQALKLLYSTPRIYKNRDILVNPKTGQEYATLGREELLNQS